MQKNVENISYDLKYGEKQEYAYDFPLKKKELNLIFTPTEKDSNSIQKTIILDKINSHEKFIVK